MPSKPTERVGSFKKITFVVMVGLIYTALHINRPLLTSSSFCNDIECVARLNIRDLFNDRSTYRGASGPRDSIANNLASAGRIDLARTFMARNRPDPAEPYATGLFDEEEDNLTELEVADRAVKYPNTAVDLTPLSHLKFPAASAFDIVALQILHRHPFDGWVDSVPGKRLSEAIVPNATLATMLDQWPKRIMDSPPGLRAYEWGNIADIKGLLGDEPGRHAALLNEVQADPINAENIWEELGDLKQASAALLREPNKDWSGYWPEKACSLVAQSLNSNERTSALNLLNQIATIVGGDEFYKYSGISSASLELYRKITALYHAANDDADAELTLNRLIKKVSQAGNPSDPGCARLVDETRADMSRPAADIIKQFLRQTPPAQTKQSLEADLAAASKLSATEATSKAIEVGIGADATGLTQIATDAVGLGDRNVTTILDPEMRAVDIAKLAALRYQITR